jgi:hypothetical protein
MEAIMIQSILNLVYGALLENTFTDVELQR